MLMVNWTCVISLIASPKYFASVERCAARQRLQRLYDHYPGQHFAAVYRGRQTFRVWAGPDRSAMLRQLQRSVESCCCYIRRLRSHGCFEFFNILDLDIFGRTSNRCVFMMCKKIFIQYVKYQITMYKVQIYMNTTSIFTPIDRSQ